MHRGYTATLLICFFLIGAPIKGANATEEVDPALYFSTLSPSAGVAINETVIEQQPMGFHAFKSDQTAARMKFFSGKSWDAGVSSGPPKYERRHRHHYGASNNNSGTIGASPFFSIQYRFE